MKNSSAVRVLSSIAFFTAFVLFLLFFAYLGFTDDTSVYQARPLRSYSQIDHYSEQLVTDTTAPAGVRREFCWTLDFSGADEASLCFYTVHQQVQVYLDGDLVYSLLPAENNRLGKSTGSNWVVVPLSLEDSGKQVTVVLTPIFTSVIDRAVEFYIGSHYAVFFSQFTHDLPQLLLAVLCIILGFFIIALTLWLNCHTSNKMYNMLFLGIFSILLGIWRLTDTRFSAIAFSRHTMLLSYLTIGVLFLICSPLLLFLDISHKQKKPTAMTFASLLMSGAAVIILALQVLGVAEFKETLVVSHCMMVASILILLVERLLLHREAKLRFPSKADRFLFILVIGALLDLFSYYIARNSAGVIFTLIAFILYAVIIFASNVFEINRSAYTDGHTGLANKARWNELMESSGPVDSSLAILMMDLNSLKWVNDTMGHDAGDKVIMNFSNILRNTLPRHSIICRWGGDKFTVLLTDVTRAQVERNIQDLHDAVDAYNAALDEPSISFAAGFAMACEFPGLSRKELLAIADSQMYRDKQNYKKTVPADSSLRLPSGLLPVPCFYSPKIDLF